MTEKHLSSQLSAAGPSLVRILFPCRMYKASKNLLLQTSFFFFPLRTGLSMPRCASKFCYSLCAALSYVPCIQAIAQLSMQQNTQQKACAALLVSALKRYTGISCAKRECKTTHRHLNMTIIADIVSCSVNLSAVRQYLSFNCLLRNLQ